MASLILPRVFAIYRRFFEVYNQLFQVDYTRLADNYYHKYENDYVDDPATAIENVLVDFNKCDQLIVVHHHAEGKVNPVRHLDLF